jgi:hypothetical protein
LLTRSLATNRALFGKEIAGGERKENTGRQSLLTEELLQDAKSAVTAIDQKLLRIPASQMAVSLSTKDAKNLHFPVFSLLFSSQHNKHNN